MFSIYVNNTPDSNKIINSTSNSVRIKIDPLISLDSSKNGNYVYYPLI